MSYGLNNAWHAHFLIHNGYLVDSANGYNTAYTKRLPTMYDEGVIDALYTKNMKLKRTNI